MLSDQILAAMAERYSGCGTYRDHGRVVTRFIHHDGHPPRSDEKPFLTAFVRPGRFRYEYSDERHRYIVGWDGSAARSWWTVDPRVKHADSLALALAGATGVSGGSAHTVPALLMPDQIGGRRLTDLDEVVSVGDERLGEVACYRLQGRFAPCPVPEAEKEAQRQEFLRRTGRLPERAVAMPLTVWIDRGTFLVRRIEERTDFETFRTETVTTYEPAVGIRVREEELRFDPPA